MFSRSTTLVGMSAPVDVSPSAGPVSADPGSRAADPEGAAGGKPANAAEAGVHDLARKARNASRALAAATTAEKNAALEAIADALVQASAEIVRANAVDVERERAAGMSVGLLDRLLLTYERIAGIAAAVREVVSLPDPVGEVVRGQRLPNGLRLNQIRVPMGVVGMIYEARPNVTVDAATLALKAGNAVLLRGGSAAEETNAVVVAVIRSALESAGLPADLVATVDGYGRAGATALMGARGLVDVLIPRGGAGLIQAVVKNSTVPVIETGVGNCHVYLDASADPDMARAIVLNSKTHRVGVCNAAETILVHADQVESGLLGDVLRDLHDAGVVLHADDRAAAVAASLGIHVEAATDDDWGREYLALEVAVGVVDDLDAALEHIRRWSSGHTEAIVTASLESADRFAAEADSAAIMVNASTRFTDGGMLGLGAEIGISTQKLHARGPMGLSELTTTRWIVHGTGHVRS